MLFPHASITLLLVALKHECVHLRLDQVHRLVGFEVILYLASKVLNLSLDLVDLGVDLAQVRTEPRIDNIVILFGFSDINTLLKHLSQLRKVLKSPLELVQDLASQRMLLIQHILIQVLAQLLQGEDHVVHFDTVYQLSIVSQFSLHSIELGIKLL